MQLALLWRTALVSKDMNERSHSRAPYIYIYIYIYKLTLTHYFLNTGTPFWFGMCCVTFPWTARNVMRYQYRIDGDDFVEDCAFPTSCCLLSFIFHQLCPSCLPCLYPYPIGLMPGNIFCLNDPSFLLTSMMNICH